jgi:alpha-tubulin suppressor-like RCC1 family protein
LGTGNNSHQKTPVVLEVLKPYNIVSIASSLEFNGARDEKGSIFTWGKNDRGQLGQPSGFQPEVSAIQPVPTRLDFLEDAEGTPLDTSGSGGQPKAVALGVGYKHMIALTGATAKKRQCWTWGSISSTRTPQLARFDVASSFIDVAAGENFCLALTEDGGVASWGNHDMGCLGLGKIKSKSSTPQFVRGFGESAAKAGVDDPANWMGKASKIRAGFNHAAVLASR